MEMAIGVTGGRDLRISEQGKKALIEILKRFGEQNDIEFIHGNCPTEYNIDKDAAKIADRYCFRVTPFDAKWAELGRKAGPIRNTEMCDYLKENYGILIVFQGGRGTNDCMRKAIDRLIPIVDLRGDRYIIRPEE